ncbi:hypothetical protein L3X38_035653 [Prunus dulcis]|uniref:Uncharacterized protein n=1 Tax=Prunus dulcis TaxID=3755 RepID=A0AAD4VK36_PRUDU|nr:hypothetical protein L3X38_035653 [Prunus dulcis]
MACAYHKRGRGGAFKTYLPGRGQWAIKKAHGLGWWPPLHLGGVPAYGLLTLEPESKILPDSAIAPNY